MVSLEQYIRNAAAQRGIDPDIAVRVARSEGGLKDPTRQSLVTKNGVREPSYGPFQLLVGGGNTGFPAGLGNDFMRATGKDPRNPEHAYAGIDFALDTAARDGWSRWYGAKAAGLSNRAGIGGAPVPGTMAVASAPPSMSGPDGPKGQETWGGSSKPVMMAANPNTPPAERPIVNTGGGDYSTPIVPGAVKNIAGMEPRKNGIADIFSLLALNNQPQPIQAAPVQGPTPEQANALNQALQALRGRLA